MQTWLITGISSGFGYEMSKQLLLRGDRIIGTVRNTLNIEQLKREYPDMLEYHVLDITDTQAIRAFVEYVFKKYEQIDVVVSNAGYGVLGAIEEISEEEIEKIIATNMQGSVMFIKSVLGYLRRQGYGRIIQMSSYNGQVAIRGWGMYCATKAGITRFCETIAQEMQPFNIGVTIVEPGAARTDYFNHVKIADMITEYDHCHASLQDIESANETKPGDPVKMVKCIIDSVEINPAPLHLLLGAKALESTLQTLKNRIAGYEEQRQLAVSTDVMDFNPKRKKKIRLIPALGERKVIIWSVGQEFENMFHWFDLTEWDSIIECFVDRDSSKAGRICAGRWIKTPEEIEDWSRYFVIVTSTAYYDSIAEELRKYGLREKVDFISWRKLIDRITLGIFKNTNGYTVSTLINGNIVKILQNGNCSVAVEQSLLQCEFDVADIDAVVYAEEPLERLMWFREENNVNSNVRLKVGQNIGNKMKCVDLLIRFSHGKWKEKIYFCRENAALAMETYSMSGINKASAVVVYGNSIWSNVIGIIWEHQYVQLRELMCPNSIELFYNAFANLYEEWEDVRETKKNIGKGYPVFYDWLKEKWIQVCEDGSVALNRECFLFDGEKLVISPKGMVMLQDKYSDEGGNDMKFRKNLFCSIQKIVEESILQTIAYAKQITNLDELCLVGGKMLEFIEKHRLIESNLFSNICVKSLDDDFNRATGAATYAYFELFDKKTSLTGELSEKIADKFIESTYWKKKTSTAMLRKYSLNNKVMDLKRYISTINEDDKTIMSAFKRQLLVDILNANE